jgi:hypothetical protein
MSEVIAFPDAEAVVVTGLSDALTARGRNAYVSTRTPNPRQPDMVRVSRTGGARRDLVTDQPMVTVECWGEDEPSASDLARLCRALVWSWGGSAAAGAWIRAVREVGGVVSLPDPATALPRYQFTVQLDTRGEAI